MVELSGKVAVVTGAASGIGYALAERWAGEGMKVVLADIEEDALETAADRLGRLGKVIAVPTDVSLAESVDDLARQAEALGQVRVVCNKAGVAGVTASAGWEKSVREWQWVVAGHVFDVVQDDRFRILPNAESITPAIKEVAATAVEGRTPPMVQPA